MRLPRLALALCGILLLIAGCKQEPEKSAESNTAFKEVTLEVTGMT